MHKLIMQIKLHANVCKNMQIPREQHTQHACNDNYAMVVSINSQYYSMITLTLMVGL